MGGRGAGGGGKKGGGGGGGNVKADRFQAATLISDYNELIKKREKLREISGSSLVKVNSQLRGVYKKYVGIRKSLKANGITIPSISRP